MPEKGYTKIADGLTHYTYTDNNVERGKEYSYIVLAEFGTLNKFGEQVNAVESLPSNQACAILKKDVPVITNVSIELQITMMVPFILHGRNRIRLILDTIQNPGPYRNVVYHSTGFNGASLNSIGVFPLGQILFINLVIQHI